RSSRLIAERSEPRIGLVPWTKPASRSGSAPASSFACRREIFMGDGETVHASCVVLSEAGGLIRRASGSGKSSLARELLHAAALIGRFACLVSDDRTQIYARHGRIIARPVVAISGLLEIRGIGILQTAHEPGAVLRLIVDLTGEDPPR